jgi:hypothetical protein
MLHLISRSLVLVFVGTLVSPSSYSGDLEQAFERLKDSGADYRPEGAVCEQVARLDLERDFPSPAYEVTTGIEYANSRQVLGELDVVVFDSRSGKVILISEVKCWQNLKSARRKAREQQERFQKHVASGVSLQFHSDKKDSYDDDQFRSSPRFITISQAGGEQAGFEQTLDFGLDEMKTLRQRLLECQSQGACRRPAR